MESLYEKTIWRYLLSKYKLHHYAIAGIMGNLMAESSLSPINVSNSYNKRTGITDEEYTKRVDNGTISEDEFSKDKAAYGLAQWCSAARKRNLYRLAKNRKCSIGAISLQLDFLMSELKNYSSILTIVSNPESIRAVSDIFLIKFENPANKSNSVKDLREAYAKEIYNRQACKKSSLPIMTVQVTCTTLNVRKGPAKTYTIVDRIRDKGTYKIYEEQGGWGKISETEDKWISLQYTKKVS